MFNSMQERSKIPCAAHAISARAAEALVSCHFLSGPKVHVSLHFYCSQRAWNALGVVSARKVSSRLLQTGIEGQLLLRADLCWLSLSVCENKHCSREESYHVHRIRVQFAS